MTRNEAVEHWTGSQFAPEPRFCRTAREMAAEGGLPEISITAHEGKLLGVFLRAASCRRVVEIGTLSGYSALWLLDAMPPDGHLYTIEIDPSHADVASAVFAEAGEEARVTLVRGKASEELPRISMHGPFDAVFIDADKAGYPEYLEWAGANLRPGGLVFAHNAFAFGQLHHDPDDPSSPLDAEQRSVVRALRAFHARLSDPSRFASAVIPTGEGLAVGVKR